MEHRGRASDGDAPSRGGVYSRQQQPKDPDRPELDHRRRLEGRKRLLYGLSRVIARAREGEADADDEEEEQEDEDGERQAPSEPSDAQLHRQRIATPVPGSSSRPP